MLSSIAQRTLVQGRRDGSDAATAVVLLLLSLLPPLAQALASDPLSGRLRDAFDRALHSCTAFPGGAAASLQSLQPLDLRYCQLYQQRLSSVSSEEWNVVWALQV